MPRHSDSLGLVDALGAMPLFAGLAADDLHDVARSVEVRDVRAGKTLIKQGHWGHETLIVLGGEVEVRRDGTVIAVEGPGSLLGEAAVLQGARRNASVVARSDVVVGAIEYSQFHALADTIPELRARLDALGRDRDPS